MRYCALSLSACGGDWTHARQLAQSHGLNVFESGDWILLTDARWPVRPLADGSLVLGHVFDRGTQRPVWAEKRADATPHSPDELLRRYWGSWLAFHGPVVQGGTACCLRDPSGGLPAYYIVRVGRLIVGSGIDMLAAAGGLAPVIDVPALARHILFGPSAGPETCIEGVHELTPGARLSVHGASAREEQLWKPAVHAAAANPATTMATASMALRDALLSCVGAWRRTYHHPLVELSGGLDSSIVAASAALSGPPLPAVTLVTSSADGDERRLARVVAAHLDMNLAERRRDIDRLDLHHAIAPQLPRPGVRGFTQESDRLIAAAAEAASADALFSGGGGDILFCLLHSSAPLADLLRVQGRPRDLLRTACDVADIAHRSFWSIVGDAWRGRGPDAGPAKARARLLSASGDLSPSPPSPLLSGVESLAPGRRAHVEGIIAMSSYLVGMGRGCRIPLVFPLMSQPIVETCLGIPSWLWVRDGHDRAVARHAVRDLLPREVVFRRSKGRLDVFGHCLFERHRPTIRTMLLDGWLTRSGIVDRVEIERQLDGHVSLKTGMLFLLLELVDIEAWVQGVAARSWAFH